MRPLPQRPVDLGDPTTVTAVASDLGDRSKQGDLVHRIEPHLAVFGSAASIDVEQIRHDVEVETWRLAVHQGEDRLELEIDDRWSQHLDSLSAPKNLRRLEVEIDILTVGPDAPLAPVDRLTNLKVPTKWAEPLGDILDRLPPPFSVSHEVPVLWDHERKLMALADESLSQLFFVAVVAVPRMETKQNGTDPQSLDLAKMEVGILWPRANGETDSTQGARMLVKGCFELAVSAADLCGRSCDNAKVSQVCWAVGEANSELLAAAGVLVGLVREVVPNRLVT